MRFSVVNVVAMIGIVGAEAAVAGAVLVAVSAAVSAAVTVTVAVLVIAPYAGTELLNVPAVPPFNSRKTDTGLPSLSVSTVDINRSSLLLLTKN